MPLTFQGGQTMPTVGTPAYSTAQQGSGAGSFNASTNALTSPQGTQTFPTSTPIYTPPQVGGATSVTPVSTSANAQADYTAKLAAFQEINNQINSQSASKLQQSQIDAQSKAMNDVRQSETNLKQQGIDIQKQDSNTQASLAASKAAAVNMAANPTDTSSPQSTSTTPPQAGNPTTNPSQPVSTDSNGQMVTALNNEQAQQQQIQQARDANTSQQLTSLNSLLAGTIPLSAPQQALITSLQTQLKQNEQEQRNANESQLGAARENAFRTGGEYSPVEMQNRLTAVITQGVQRIQALDNSAASTMAKLEIDFQKGNFEIINKGYDLLTKNLDDKSKAIKDTYDETTSLMKDQRNYQMDVAKFNQTKDQNAFDRAFKVEQQMFEEKYKTEQQAYTQKKDSTTEKETSRHNRAMENIDSFKAGMQSGGNGGSNNITSAKITSNGVDPVSQKQTFDQISSNYGPMTATAIKSLANYEMNPTDWKAGATKGMTRDMAVTLAKMLNPNYSDAKYPVVAKNQLDLESNHPGTIGYQKTAVNTAIDHLTSYDKTMSTLPNSPVGFENAFRNSVGVLDFNLQTNIAKAKSDAQGFGTEFAKYLTGNAPDVHSIDEQKAGLSTSNAPATTRGVVQSKLDLLTGKLSELNQQQKDITGSYNPTQLLSPEAVRNLSDLKNKGYDVKIPGVYYTDPTVYVKASLENQKALDTVRGLHPELTPAQAAQLAQYQQENGQ